MRVSAKLWLVWFIATICGASALLAAMITPGQQALFLIGRTTSGHHQIELACSACHMKAFGGRNTLQESCIQCHGEELKHAKDSHPAKKFRDPRNADRLEKLNATLCLTCHREHKPELTGAMGVTVPQDYCLLCHTDIGKERPSHEGLAFTSCADAGCHNFHDNRALYEDFLVKHADEPAISPWPVIKLKGPKQPSGPAPLYTASTGAPGKTKQPLTQEQADAPPGKRTEAILSEWSGDIHAAKGVNCGGCHVTKQPDNVKKQWTDRPGMAVCADCHEDEQRSFTEGKHGMRLRDHSPALSPMRPELARIALKPEAHGNELTCARCHGPHGFDTVKAQVEGCLNCHDDRHSRAYRNSPHHKLWLAEQAGGAPRGSGVSCASCHMPRTERRDSNGESRIFVTHNQNDNLRPNEKMVRSVCSDCHGLAFTLNALADLALIESNFDRPPERTVKSIEWAKRRAEAKR